MKSDADKLTRLRQERDTLREPVAVMEEIQALQARLRAIPYAPYVPAIPIYPTYPWVQPWYPSRVIYGGVDVTLTATTQSIGALTQSNQPVLADDSGGVLYRS